MNFNGGEIRDALESIGFKVGFLIAGFAGGLVSITQMKGLTRKQMIGVLFTSLATSGYSTPALVAKLELQTDAYKYMCAFMVGLCAMRIIPLVLSAVPAIWQWVVTRFSGGAIQPTQGDGGDNK